MNERIDFVSEVGKGTTFCIDVPRAGFGNFLEWNQYFNTGVDLLD